LAIVYQIVQAHEGKVWARSKLGEGSVFVLRLRRVTVAEKVAALQPPAVQSAEAPQLPSETGENIAAAAGIGGRANG
jgi:hypothetical protein